MYFRMHNPWVMGAGPPDMGWSGWSGHAGVS